MILTITMNPSVDISYSLEEFKLNTVNRADNCIKTPGGKGLNVTRVLAQLGNDVLASGLTGGILGKEIQEKLNLNGIRNSFFEISKETRNCIAILHGGKQTEILESGPSVTPEESRGFLKHLDSLINDASVVTISGSLPKGIKESFYVDIIEMCNKKNRDVVLDCSGKALLSVLNSKYKPKVIKPNLSELSQLMNKVIPKDFNILKEVLCEDLFSGIEWIIVSLGKDGAFARHHDRFYKVNVPEIEAVNPVGSGDSTVAGIASALEEGRSDEGLLRAAATCGTLNAMESRTGYIDIAKYGNIYSNIEILKF